MKKLAGKQVEEKKLKRSVSSRDMWELCCDGNLEGVKAALGRGEDVNGRGGYCNGTGLMEAMGGQHDAVVQLLLDQDNIDINCQDRDGRTALHWAAAWGNARAVEKLVNKPGQGLNVRDSDGRSPLMWAVWEGKEQIVSQLLEVPGVEQETIDGQGRTLEQVAREWGHADILKILEEGRKKGAHTKKSEEQREVKRRDDKQMQEAENMECERERVEKGIMGEIELDNLKKCHEQTVRSMILENVEKKESLKRHNDKKHEKLTNENDERLEKVMYENDERMSKLSCVNDDKEDQLVCKNEDRLANLIRKNAVEYEKVTQKHKKCGWN